VRSIEVLVANHLAPAQFVSQGAGPRAYRRLARKLALGDVTVVDLERLARADHLGRGTTADRAGDFEAGETFLAAAEAAEVREGARPDIVSASQLIARGVDAGPRLGPWTASSKRNAESRDSRLFGSQLQRASSAINSNNSSGPGGGDWSPNSR